MIRPYRSRVHSMNELDQTTELFCSSSESEYRRVVCPAIPPSPHYLRSRYRNKCFRLHGGLLNRCQVKILDRKTKRWYFKNANKKLRSFYSGRWCVVAHLLNLCPQLNIDLLGFIIELFKNGKENKKKWWCCLSPFLKLLRRHLCSHFWQINKINNLTKCSIYAALPAFSRVRAPSIARLFKEHRIISVFFFVVLGPEG